MIEEKRKLAEEVAVLLKKNRELQEENEANKQAFEACLQEHILAFKHSRTWMIGSIFILPCALLNSFIKNPVSFSKKPREHFKRIFNLHYPPAGHGSEKLQIESGFPAPDCDEADTADQSNEPKKSELEDSRITYGLDAAPKANDNVTVAGIRKDSSKYTNEIIMASVTDEFSTACGGEDVGMIPLTLGNWEEVFSNNEIDLLFVESAWHGHNRSWEGIIPYANRTENAKILQDLTEYAGKRNVPTIFWNKEDPPDYENFQKGCFLF